MREWESLSAAVKEVGACEATTLLDAILTGDRGSGGGGTRLLCVQNKNVGQVVSSESGAGWNRKRLSGFCPVGNEQQQKTWKQQKNTVV